MLADVGGDDGVLGGQARDRVADLLDGLVRQADDCGHGTGNGLAAFLHGAGADSDQEQGIFECNGTGGGQGGEFAEGMASDHVRGEVFKAGGQDDRMQEDSGLGHLGGLQVLGGSFEHDVGNAETQDFIGPLEHFFCFGIVFV